MSDFPLQKQIRANLRNTFTFINLLQSSLLSCEKYLVIKIRHIASFEALLVSLEALPVPTDAHAAMSMAIPAPLGQKPRWIVCEE